MTLATLHHTVLWHSAAVALALAAVKEFVIDPRFETDPPQNVWPDGAIDFSAIRSVALAHGCSRGRLPLSDRMAGPPPPGAQCQPALGNAPGLAQFNDICHVVCVLRGDWPHEARGQKWRVPDLGEHYVDALYGMVSRHAPRNQPWRFTCFTDRKAHHLPHIPTRPLPEGLYGWFAKLYLFSPEAFPVGTRVLYFDLDTCIVGNLAGLAGVELQRPVFLRGMWPSVHASTGIFSFRSGPSLYPIWREFEAQSKFAPPYKTPRPITPHLGKVTTDELWVRHFVTAGEYATWQDLFPGEVVSYKNVFRPNGSTGKEKVIYFHGLPRPHTVKEPWNPIGREIEL